MAQGYTKGVPIDTDNTLTLNSDLLVPSQKAIKFYVDARTGSALRWDNIYDPTANQSIIMSAYITDFNWATGTSTNNLFSLTTDASANGTGALLNLATGASSTINPLLVKAGATTALTVDASAQVLVDTNLGVGVAVPTARIHLVAGDIDPFTAPLKFTTGSLLDTPEEGVIEYDGSNFYITNDFLERGLIPITTTGFGSGSVLFSSSSYIISEDNSNFFWDSTNKTLGVGTTRTGAISGTNPSLRILGTGATSATSSFEVQNSATTSLFFVRNDGLVKLGTKGTYTESSGQFALTTSGSGAGVLLGGDANLYRDSADALKTDDTFQALRIGAGTTPSATSVITVNQNFNTFPTATTRYSLDITTNGTVASGGNGSLRTLNFATQGNGGETFTEITCFNSAAYSNATVTVSNLVGYTNQCVVSNTGLVTSMFGYRSFFNCSAASGGGATNARHFEVRTPSFGTAGNITSHSGLYINDIGHASRVTNAYGVYITGQTASATASYGIYFAGTSGAARDGITWNADTNLYRSAADILKTDDGLVVSKALACGVSTLSDGATPALNAANGNTFLLTAAGDRTIGIPTNPTSGQRIIIVHKASGANRTLALNTGTGGFRFGTTITALTATTSGLTDYIEAIYNSADNKWDIVNYIKGF